jgi:hypothetical protein
MSRVPLPEISRTQSAGDQRSLRWILLHLGQAHPDVLTPVCVVLLALAAPDIAVLP